MRYLIRILGLCVLALIPFFACMDFDLGEPPEGCGSYDWDWGGSDGPGPWPGPGPGPGPSPDPCQGVVCPDDGSECTEEYCSGGVCGSRPVPNGTPCDFDSTGAGGFGGSGGAGGFGGSGGVADDGVCVNGVCGENLCKDVVCDDDDVCTDDSCDYVDGTCHFTPVVCNDHNRCTEDTCDPADGCIFTAVEDGTGCSGRFGMCEASSCVAPCDLASDEEYQCPIIGLEDLFCCPDSEYCRGDCTVPDCQTSEDCDDGNECTRDSCDASDGTCTHTPIADNTQCEFDGLPGRCISGRCAELCEGVTCEDTECKTDGVCDPSDGVCDYEMVAEDGTACSEGECLDGVCAPLGAFRCTEQGIRDAIAQGGGPHFFACDGPTTVVTTAEIVVDNNVVLDGEGNLTVDANDAHRVFSMASGVTTELRGMTVTGGRATEVLGEGGGIHNAGDLTLTNSTVSENTAYDGGGIHNAGDLTLTNSTVSGNSASRGGGIFSWGTVTVINSTVSANAAYSGGGGVYNGGGGTLTNSTVSGNSARDGGGLTNAGTLTVTNSTVSGNTAGIRGGGIHNTRWGELTVTNSTVSGNSAEHEGGGVYNDRGEATLTRSIIDGDCGYSANISGGYNIESPGDTCRLDPDGTDLVDVPDPMLGPLQDNGGLTMTHALLPGSPAMNRIPAAACEVDTDQRGEPRPETGGTMCDVGSVEVQPEL